MSTERAKEAARKWLREQAETQRFSGDFRLDHVPSLADLLDSVRLDEARWWFPHWPIHQADYQATLGKPCPCTKCQRIAALERTARGESQ